MKRLAEGTEPVDATRTAIDAAALARLHERWLETAVHLAVAAATLRPLRGRSPRRMRDLFAVPLQFVPGLSGRKNSRSSRASASGCSIAAKWPPRGITVQRRIW